MHAPLLIAGSRLRRDDPAGDARLQAALAEAWASKQRPLCLCQQDGVEMYVARCVGRFIVKRMPNTGANHTPGCDSYEPPPEISGQGEVVGSAIDENPIDGTTTLKLAFPLTKTGSRQAPAQGDGNGDTVSADTHKLSLLALLHYLWDEAGFTRWSPAMTGKRSWSVLHKFLAQAAENKVAKGTSLLEQLYIPEQFASQRKDEISERRMSQLTAIGAAHNRTRRLMILVGEVKEFSPGRYGHRLLIKHMPDFPFDLAEDLYKRILKRFEAELKLWNALEQCHLVTIATFSVDATAIPSIEEFSVMVVNDNWIPIENGHDKALIDRLTNDGRRFFRGLRYNLSPKRPVASLVLTDTSPVPTALYIIPPGADDDYNAALKSLTAGSRLQSWIWNPGEGAMPPIPLASFPPNNDRKRA